MSKVIYPITASYVNTWDPARALAELVSNTLDGSIEFKQPFSVKYDERRRVLTLINENTKLSRDALLLGESSKRNGGDQTVGQFGEGLKLGCLVLRRERFPVTIKNGRDETWKPAIEKVDQFEKPVLVMNIQKASRQTSHLVVEVEGVEPELWKDVESRFLALRSSHASIRSTSEGDVLTDPADAGKIFVRGVYVCFFRNYTCGYNFKNVRVGRDREIPSTYDMQDNMMSIWDRMVDVEDSPVRAQDVKALYELINSDRPEAEMLKYPGIEVAKLLAEEFKSRHGEDAIPVATTTEANELEHYGVKGVVVTGHLVYAITRYDAIRTAASFKRSVRFEHVKAYTPAELGETEYAIYLKVMKVLGAVSNVTMERLNIVEFRDPKVLGRHMGNDKPVEVSKKVLSDFGTAMTTVIHEFAHDLGGDGTASHTDAIATLTQRVFNHLSSGA